MQRSLTGFPSKILWLIFPSLRKWFIFSHSLSTPTNFPHSSQRLKITHLLLIHKNERFIEVERLGLNNRIFKNLLRPESSNIIAECESQCQFVDNSVLERCSQPYDAGNCHSDISRHYFDMAKGACICALVYHYYFFYFSKWSVWVNLHPLGLSLYFSGIWGSDKALKLHSFPQKRDWNVVKCISFVISFCLVGERWHLPRGRKDYVKEIPLFTPAVRRREREIKREVYCTRDANPLWMRKNYQRDI